MVITSANSTAKVVIGGVVEGSTIKAIMLEKNAKMVEEMVTRVFETDIEYTTNITITQGEYANHHYSFSVSPIGLQAGVRSVMVVAKDITERKNTEQMVLDALIEGQEKEQRRVARELHDGLGQLFTAMNIHLQVLSSNIEHSDAESAAISMKEVNELIAQALKEVKGIGRNLLPDVLLHHGLIPAIKDLCRLMQTEKTKIDFTSVETKPEYSEKVELALYRCCQEMLNNSMKYANASTIEIQLVDHEDSIVLMVEDNGTGMKKGAINTGHGLNNLKIRAEALGGTFTLESETGKGLLAYIEIPLNQ
jgi:signal transduction histidine kinase